MHHLGKPLFQQGLQRRLRATGQHLGDKGAAVAQHVKGKQRRRFAQGHDPQMVGLPVTAGGGGHIAQHHIGLPPQPGPDLRIGTIVEKVQHMQIGPGDRRHLLQINPQHAADRLALPDPQCIDPHHRHLTPAAGGAAQINHPRPGQQKAELFIKFEDLVGGAAPVAFELGALYIGVVQLPFQPQR